MRESGNHLQGLCIWAKADSTYDELMLKSGKYSLIRLATDLNQFRGEQTTGEGAIEPVRLALLDDDEPTGGFSGRDGELPW